MRGQPAHFAHSKVMAWVAFDRAVQAVERYGHDGPVDRWRTLRDGCTARSANAATTPERSTFTQSYGSSTLDAAC